MIAIDTNILVRLLVRDEPDQYAKAISLLEEITEAGDSCYLSDAVLCETAWVLASGHGASRSDILAALSSIAVDGRYTFDDPEAVDDALRRYETGRADFADYLIGVRARRRGVRTTYTFDRALRDEAGFTRFV